LGYTDEAGRILRRGLALVDPHREPVLAAELHGYLARSQYAEGNLGAAGGEFAESLRLLRAAPQPVAGQVESLLLIHAAALEHTQHGATMEGQRMVDRALARAREVGEASPVFALALARHGALLWERKRYEDGERELRAAIAIDNRMSPRPLETCVAMLVLAQDLMRSGRVAEAGSLMADARPCIERSFKPGSMVPVLARLADLELVYRSGRPAEIIEPLRRLETEATQTLPNAGLIQGELLRLRGLAECKSQRPADGAADLIRARERLAGTFVAESGAAIHAAGFAEECAPARLLR
jgi:ATP/maltotriose-dependent transcriptional regulator MalT